MNLSKLSFLAVLMLFGQTGYSARFSIRNGILGHGEWHTIPNPIELEDGSVYKDFRYRVYSSSPYPLDFHTLHMHHPKQVPAPLMNPIRNEKTLEKVSLPPPKASSDDRPLYFFDGKTSRSTEDDEVNFPGKTLKSKTINVLVTFTDKDNRGQYLSLWQIRSEKFVGAFEIQIQEGLIDDARHVRVMVDGTDLTFVNLNEVLTRRVELDATNFTIIRLYPL